MFGNIVQNARSNVIVSQFTCPSGRLTSQTSAISPLISLHWSLAVYIVPGLTVELYGLSAVAGGSSFKQSSSELLYAVKYK